MMTVVPNSGILQDDRLDRLRGDAVTSARNDGIPSALVHYLRALESAYLGMKQRERLTWLKEIDWPPPKDPDQ